ncbi:MAG: histidine kinase [Clostridia bacterium]|nr:histidine kinase [Clostridia bacterium]
MVYEQLGAILNQDVIDFLSSVLPPLLILLGLALAVRFDSYIGSKQKKAMRWVIVLSLCLVAQNCLPVWFPYVQKNRTFHTTLSVLGYSLRPAILLLYIIIVSPDRKCLPEMVLVLVNALLYFSAYFWPLTFWWTNNMKWMSGPLRNACLFVSLFLLTELVWITVRRFRKESGRELLLPLFSALVIIAMIFLDYNVGGNHQYVSFLTVGIVTGDLFFYIWLHLQFVREHEKDLRAEQRIRIMMSQIQPHFLFNTLTAIRSLCRTDPENAERVTTLFSNYLRQNLDSLETQELIPLKKELEHAKIYADIEMTRFPNVRVEYDIQDWDCSVPALTIQPLVENAIRHGVRIRKEGLVEVATRRVAQGHEIRIRDNGTGFDVQKAAAGSGTHIGLQNVRERIEKICHGSMRVSSRIGTGTEIVILLPAVPAPEQPEKGPGKEKT